MSDMAEKLFLVHVETKRRFEVLSVDREEKTITLKGEYSTFKDVYDPTLFKQRGYKLEKINDD